MGGFGRQSGANRGPRGVPEDGRGGQRAPGGAERLLVDPFGPGAGMRSYLGLAYESPQKILSNFANVVLGGSGRRAGPTRDHPERLWALLGSPLGLLGLPWGRNGSSKGAMMEPKWHLMEPKWHLGGAMGGTWGSGPPPAAPRRPKMMQNGAKMEPKWCHQAPKMKPERSKIEAIWDEKEVCSPNRLHDSWGNKSPYRYQSGPKRVVLAVVCVCC